METGLTGFDEVEIEGAPERTAVIRAISLQTPDRMRTIAQAMRHGLSDEDIHGVTMFDPWFLARIREIVEAEADVRSGGLPRDAEGLRDLKMMGFTDARLAALTGLGEADVRRARLDVGVQAVFKRDSIPAPPSLRRRHRICTRPMRPPPLAMWSARRGHLTRKKW